LRQREREYVAVAAEPVHTGNRPLEQALGSATGAKKGAITKHIHRVVDSFLEGVALTGDDLKFAEGVEAKNLERARELGNGLLKDAIDGWTEGQDIRELTNDLCLRTDGKIRKEDLDSLI